MPQDLTDDYHSTLVGVVRQQAIAWTNVYQVLPHIFCHLTRMSEALFDWLESMKIDVALMDGIIRYWFLHRSVGFNTLRPRQNGRHFADNILKCIFVNENVWISLKISLKFVVKVRVNNIAALVQIMAWRRPSDKPLSEPMMFSLLTHICITGPLWVKDQLILINMRYFSHLWCVRINKIS